MIVLRTVLGAACALAVAACSGVPQSVRIYAAELPARADGQYALVSDDTVKKGLVTKDSELQCKIDLEDKKDESQSAACACAKSSGDWRTDCKGWLGSHTPAADAPPAPAPAPPAGNG